VAPQIPRLAVVLIPDYVPYECSQDKPADPCLYRLSIVRIYLDDGLETYPAMRIGLEYAVDEAE
jgi:hypothetical protein